MTNNETINNLWIFCIVGGTGAGKTAVARKMLEKHNNLHFSVSATTKPLSNEELKNKDYYLYSLRQFNEAEKLGLFIETNPFATGHRYGTLLSELENSKRENKVLIVDCEVNGAINIFNKHPDNTACIFLDVSDEESETRIQNSNTRIRDNIPQRIKNLREQRIMSKNQPAIKLIFDTTKISEDVIFSVVDTFFMQEFYTRKNLKIS